jgi:hypothetical protein
MEFRKISGFKRLRIFEPWLRPPLSIHLSSAFSISVSNQYSGNNNIRSETTNKLLLVNHKSPSVKSLQHIAESKVRRANRLHQSGGWDTHTTREDPAATLGKVDQHGILEVNQVMTWIGALTSSTANSSSTVTHRQHGQMHEIGSLQSSSLVRTQHTW